MVICGLKWAFWLQHLATSTRLNQQNVSDIELIQEIYRCFVRWRVLLIKLVFWWNDDLHLSLERAWLVGSSGPTDRTIVHLEGGHVEREFQMWVAHLTKAGSRRDKNVSENAREVRHDLFVNSPKQCRTNFPSTMRAFFLSPLSSHRCTDCFSVDMKELTVSCN